MTINICRHSGAGRNPVVLFNVPLGFVLATQVLFYDWIPAYAGMTGHRRYTS
jgi:hypothetical protein